MASAGHTRRPGFAWAASVILSTLTFAGTCPEFMGEASSPQLPARTLGELKMRIVPALLSSVIVCGLLAIRMATAADAPPAWAYTPNNPDYKPPVDDGKPVRVQDSTAGYTWSQLRDRFIAPVWHPSDHGALPDIVANGRKPGVFACGYCHRATGPGGPENADLAGLPKSYIIQQMADYKSGARGTTSPGEFRQS